MNWAYSCRQVAQLLSRRLDEPLGPVDSLRLRVHLSMCGNCSNVDEQLCNVDALAADLFSGNLVVSHDGEPTPTPPPRNG